MYTPALKRTVERWRIVPNPIGLVASRLECHALVLGHLAKPNPRELWETGARIRCVSLVFDLAVEYEIKEHFAEGYSLKYTFFSEEALAGKWDVVIAQASSRESHVMGDAAKEILALSKVQIIGAEFWLIPCANGSPNSERSIIETEVFVE